MTGIKCPYSEGERESKGEWEMQREGEKTTDRQRERERALFMSLGVLLLYALWELLVLLSNPSAGQGDWDDEGVNWYSKTFWSWQAISGGRVAFVCSERSERQSIGLPVSSALSFHSFPSLLHQCDWSIFSLLLLVHVGFLITGLFCPH